MRGAERIHFALRCFFFRPFAVIFLAALLCPAAVAGAPGELPRQRLLLDFDWKFHLGTNVAPAGTNGPANLAFDDSRWRPLQLPHDWAVELPLDATADADHGFKPLGPKFPQNSVAWYRRAFVLPASDAGRPLALEFDGVFRDCRIFVNGSLVGRAEGGYDRFRCDITSAANCGGTNIVAVYVDASRFEERAYEGAGIYRHVWLVKTQPLAIAPDGVFVFVDRESTNSAPGNAALVRIAATLTNSQSVSAAARVEYDILSPDGNRVGHAAAESLRVFSQNVVELSQPVLVASPVLWSP